jgi:hypothetical protein
MPTDVLDREIVRLQAEQTLGIGDGERIQYDGVDQCEPIPNANARMAFNRKSLRFR